MSRSVLYIQEKLWH